MKTFTVLSVLLTYPSEELQQAVPIMMPLLQEEGILTADSVARLAPLLQALEHQDLYELQEQYVLLFDRSRSLSLNLFEHVHGEGRDRGGAMVDLLETYRQGGVELISSELPDHLPVLLEFLSTQPLETAQDILADAGHILVALAERLEKRRSSYAAVFQALVAFAHADASSEQAQELLAQPTDNPEDLEALDAVWQEAQVMFGPTTNESAAPQVHEAPIRIHRPLAATDS